MGHCSDTGAARGKPLVLLLPGPPGHGKTFAAMSLAQTLVPEEDVLSVACRLPAQCRRMDGVTLESEARLETDGDG